MPTRTLPRHPRTGLLAVGWRKPRPGEDGPQPVWPILGGADDDALDGDQDDGDEPDADDDGDEPDDDEWARVVKGWKAQGLKPGQVAARLEASRKWEQRAKKNSAAAEELARLKREGMSEVEAAVAAARAEERVKGGERIARATFLAAAKGRLPEPQAIVEEINLRKYVDDDGEVDDEAIAKLVDKLAPRSGKDDDTDDDTDERDTRRRRRPGSGYQGARNGSGRSKSKRGAVDGDSLFEELFGRKPRTSQT